MSWTRRTATSHAATSVGATMARTRAKARATAEPGWRVAELLTEASPAAGRGRLESFPAYVDTGKFDPVFVGWKTVGTRFGAAFET